MKYGMDEKEHHEKVQRALALGRSGQAEALPELMNLMKSPSPEIRRLSASAIGKLAAAGAEATTALAALTPVARSDRHPQVQQYAIKAIKVYGIAAESCLPLLEDLAANPSLKDYVQSTAASAVEAIRAEIGQREARAERRCERCHHPVALDEYERSMRLFQRCYCDKCFDETCTQRRNFETRVEEQKRIHTVDGTLVQSDGEKRIAEWLHQNGIDYRYDGRLRIMEGFQIRPDFYLPAFDVYIEYWGMDTPRYKAGMYLKQDLYMHNGKKLISIYPADKPRLDELMRQKLAAFGWVPPGVDKRSESAG